MFIALRSVSYPGRYGVLDVPNAVRLFASAATCDRYMEGVSHEVANRYEDVTWESCTNSIYSLARIYYFGGFSRPYRGTVEQAVRDATGAARVHIRT